MGNAVQSLEVGKTGDKKTLFYQFNEVNGELYVTLGADETLLLKSNTGTEQDFFGSPLLGGAAVFHLTPKETSSADLTELQTPEVANEVMIQAITNRHFSGHTMQSLVHKNDVPMNVVLTDEAYGYLRELHMHWLDHYFPIDEIKRVESVPELHGE